MLLRDLALPIVEEVVGYVLLWFMALRKQEAKSLTDGVYHVVYNWTRFESFLWYTLGCLCELYT